VIAGKPELPISARPGAEIRIVTPDYFKTMGIQTRRGRVFADADVQGAGGVLVVSESLARRHFPNEDPIGQRVTLGWRKVSGDIVGVVADVKELGLREQAEPILYVPLAQAPIRNVMAVVVRATGSSAATESAIRAAVRSMDSNLAVSNLETLDDAVAESVAHSRFYMLLLGLFAGTALVLAAIGIFGVMSNAVAQRTREIGIRIALGAPLQQVRGLVVRDALFMAIGGLVVGLAAAVPMSQLMTTLLFELTPTDPVTLALVVLVLFAVALLASYLPARRASRVDPLVALRAE
jgi:putative ABC transport system permease protein